MANILLLFSIWKKIIYMLMVSTIFKRLACTLVCQVNKKRGHKIISTKWWSRMSYLFYQFSVNKMYLNRQGSTCEVFFPIMRSPLQPLISPLISFWIQHESTIFIAQP